MAISYIGIGTPLSTSTTGTYSVTLPAGVQTGDYLLLFVANASYTINTTGWTLKVADYSGFRMFVYCKFAISGEGSVSITQSNNNGTYSVLAYRGVNDIDVISTLVDVTSTSISPASITTTAPSDYVINFYAGGLGTPATWTPPTGPTTLMNVAASSTVRGALIVHELQAAKGANTIRTATVSASSQMNNVTIALSSTPGGKFLPFF